MPRRTQEVIPLEPSTGNSVPVDKKIGRQITSGYKKFSDFFDKKTLGVAAVSAFLGYFIPLCFTLEKSDWLNEGQVEHRQLMTEIARPYISFNKKLTPYSATLHKGFNQSYMLQEGRFNFTGCLWACYQGGRLPASIHSAKEEQYIQDFVKKTNKGAAWLSLAKLEDYEWKNLDDSPVDYENWDNGEPSNKGKKKFCAQMSPSQRRWQTVECNKILSLCICKDHANTCSGYKETTRLF